MPKRGSGKGRFVVGNRRSGDLGAGHRLIPEGSEVSRSETELKVVVMDARSPGGRQDYDCSGWLVAPEMATEFAHVLPRVLTKRNTARTKQQLVYDLTNGFFAFCASLPADSALNATRLNQGLVTQFAEYLRRATKDDGSPRYAISTRRHYLGALRSIIDVLRATGKVSEEITLPAIKGREEPKTRPMDRKEYARFIAVCLRDVTECMSSVGSMWNGADKARARTSKPSGVVSPIARAVARAMEAYTILPERQWLQAHDPQLFATVDVAYRAVMKAMHPMSQHLTPFIFYLAAVTMYNTQPLLEMRLEDAIETSILGVARLSLHPYKTRGKQYQHRSFVVTDEPDNPARIIRFLIDWTEPLRECVPLRFRNQLFLYVCRNRGCAQKASPMYDRDRGFSPKFAANAALYCKKKGFPAIGTRLLRATGADLANELFDGDPLSVGTLLGHVGAGSVLISYRSEQAKQRDEVRLAGAMAARDRWIHSNGKVDVRAEPADADRSAATPGFRCIDPYDSPIAGEKRGRQCTAYGFCPNCPLAQPAADSGYAVARLLQLRERLLDARDRHGVAVWRARFADQVGAIDAVWLPTLADDNALNRAARMQLNPLPPID